MDFQKSIEDTVKKTINELEKSTSTESEAESVEIVDRSDYNEEDGNILDMLDAVHTPSLKP